MAYEIERRIQTSEDALFVLIISKSNLIESLKTKQIKIFSTYTIKGIKTTTTAKS